MEYYFYMCDEWGFINAVPITCLDCNQEGEVEYIQHSEDVEEKESINDEVSKDDAEDMLEKESIDCEVDIEDVEGIEGTQSIEDNEQAISYYYGSPLYEDWV